MTNEFVTSQLVVMVVNHGWLVMKRDPFCQILEAGPLQPVSRCLVTEARSEFACLHVGGDVGVGYLLICRVSLQVSCWLNQNFSKGSKTCIVLEDMY